MELETGTYSSPRFSFELLDCAMPVTMDTYSSCSFQCQYCFSFFQKAIGDSADDYLHHRIRAVNVERVKKLVTGELKSQFKWYFKQRKTLQWGGLADPLCHYESQFGKSLELLKFFNEIDYPLSLSTKGTWFTKDPRYEEVFKDRKNIHIKSSIITLNEQMAHDIERGVSTTEERFKTLEWFNKVGVAATTFRFRPFILGVSADYPYTANSYAQLDALFHRAKEAGCYSATSEFLCWESRASNTAKQRLELISKISGIPNLFAFYQHNSAKAGLMRLNYEIKRPYFDAMFELADKYGLKMFISDAHHKEKSHSSGCCGLPDEGPLSNTNKGQFAEAILIAKKNGSVHWNDISKDAEWLRQVPFQADGFNSGGTEERVKRMYQTMFDYMHDGWNNTKSALSPARYFGGVLVPGSVDEHGDIVYLYNAPLVLNKARIQTVSQLQTDLVQRGYDMQQDGSAWGHVAFPVLVNAGAVSAGQNELLDACEKARMQYTLYVVAGASDEFLKFYPNADVIELVSALSSEEEILMQANVDGLGKIWILDASKLTGVNGNLRALLSGAEQKFTDGEGFELPVGALLTQTEVHEPVGA